MQSPTHLFVLMKQLFWGFGVALGYGAATSGSLWFLGLRDDFPAYLDAYFISFNCLISGGLIIGTALFVLLTQGTVPAAIEAAFDDEALRLTDYATQKARYLSARRSISFSTDFVILGFILFVFCKFPFRGPPEYFLIFWGSLQYALGVYVGRKLFYVGEMLNSLYAVNINRDIFAEDDLGHITTYVNILSTLTVVFVYMHVAAYYNGPFDYNTVIGRSIRIALLLPAVIALPVLVIFNFYPRMVLRRLYRRAIADKVQTLTDKLKDDNLSEFERLSYIIQYDKISKDELGNRLRLTLSDLPIGITIIIMVVGLLIKGHP